jgi:hypothetical protein
MIIGFTGAHRVGKTTTAIETANYLGYVYEAMSAAPLLARLGTDAREAKTFADRMAIQEKILDFYVEKLEALPVGNYILDRTPLCFIGYTLAEYARGQESPELASRLKDYVKRCQSLTEKFDGVVYVAPGIPLVDEAKSAVADEMYIEHLSALIVYYLQHTKVASRQLHNTDRLSRKMTSVAFISSLAFS